LQGGYQVDAFLAPLPVARIPGVGKVMNAKLEALGIHNCADLRARDANELERRFGSYGRRLSQLARGIDERAVVPDQPVQSISAEDTFSRDLPLNALEPMIRELATKTWKATRKTQRIARTVVLKLKTADFHILTRSYTPPQPPRSERDLAEIAVSLRERVNLPATTLYRLVGVGLSNFRNAEELAQTDLFAPVANE